MARSVLDHSILHKSLYYWVSVDVIGIMGGGAVGC